MKYKITIMLNNGYRCKAYSSSNWPGLQLGSEFNGGQVVAYIIEQTSTKTEGK